MRLEEYKIIECSCQECISYCKKRPGWFRPEEIAPLAESLGLIIEETFQKYLIIDYWCTDDSIYLLSPAKDLDKLLFSKDPLKRELASLYLESNKILHRDCDRAGSYASFAYAFVHAPCIFLRDDRCSIYSVRPFECKVTWHKNSDSIFNIRKLIAEEWKHSKLLEQLDLFDEFHRPVRRFKLSRRIFRDKRKR